MSCDMVPANEELVFRMVNPKRLDYWTDSTEEVNGDVN